MDNRIFLELDSVVKYEDNWDIKLFYSPKDNKQLLELIKPFDDFIVAKKTYNLNSLEDVFHFRIGSSNHSNPKQMIEDILSNDNEAILQAAIDCPILSKLCMFKIKVMREGKVGVNNFDNVEDLFED